MDKIIFLVGPTAVGKTEAAVYLAKKIKGEIISCDSMQIYQGMEILSSQPSLALRKKFAHHLLGILPPVKEYNVTKYRKDAVKKMKEIIKEGKTPIFVGGTGLYMSILIDGIFKAKSENKAVRLRLYKEAEDFGKEYLFNKLKNVDTHAASKIHPHDTKRIVRALEVFESTGKPISFLQKQRKGIASKYEVKIFCLNMERAELYQRIEERVHQMFACGLLEEVKKLLAQKLGKTAQYAIGIRELKGYFDGEYDLNEAQRRMIINTQRYAKRQLTWFRKDKRIHWLNIHKEDGPKDVADKIWNELY